MQNTKDISTLGDIKLLVDTFYEKVRADGLIGPIFNNAIKDRWPVHLETMYRFWQTILLEKPTYHGSPFTPHAKLPVGREHFDSWLSMWKETIDELFIGDTASEAKWRAEKMAEIFLIKIEYYKDKPFKPLT